MFYAESAKEFSHLNITVSLFFKRVPECVPSTLGTTTPAVIF